MEYGMYLEEEKKIIRTRKQLTRPKKLQDCDTKLFNNNKPPLYH
jgi:hypothetical protein